MKITNAKFEISQPDYRQSPAHDKPEYAFIGRSNVGKSSLINMLTGRKGLAKTSQTPGKTLLINHFSINDGEWYIVDLPGYGYAARGKEQRSQLKSLIDNYVLHRSEMTLLFVLIDIRHEPQKIDLDFLRMLGENGVPFAIIFTKADKLGPVACRRSVEAYSSFLAREWEELPRMFVTSSASGSGRDEVLDYIDSINKMLKEEKKGERGESPLSE